MGDTEIGWTHRPGTRGRTWNPVKGCEACSPGCAHCYAARTAIRFAGEGKPFEGFVTRAKNGLPIWTGDAALVEHKLIEPFSWREPSTVFANSMSDLFFDGFSFEQIAAVFAVMALTPEHTYQVLTKRPKRALEFFAWLLHDEWLKLNVAFQRHVRPLRRDNYWLHRFTDLDHPLNPTAYPLGSMWPLPNVWLGVSAEDQANYDERLPYLLEMPAAVKFLSLEPLLGPIDLDLAMCPGCNGTDIVYGEDGATPFCTECGDGDDAREMAYGWWNYCDGGVAWVIMGSESGPDARACEAEWLRDLVKQCQDAGIPPFLKQAYAVGYGDCAPVMDGVGFGPGSKRKTGMQAGHGGMPTITAPYLDGKQYLEFPEIESDGDGAAVYGG